MIKPSKKVVAISLLVLVLVGLGFVVNRFESPVSGNSPIGAAVAPVYLKIALTGSRAILPLVSTWDFGWGSTTATSSAPFSVDPGLNLTKITNLTVTGTCTGCSGSTFTAGASVSPWFNVGGYTRLSGSVVQIASNSNSFAQLNLQNFSSAASASGDYVVTRNNGTNSVGFADWGINSTGYQDSTFTITGKGDAYLFNQTQNLAIGTASSSAAVGLKFFTGGTLAANSRFTIFNTGASFSIPVEITGAASVSGAFVQNSVASNSFLGDITGPTTGTLSVGTSNNPLKTLWSNIVRAVVSLFLPTTTSTTASLNTAAASGQALINTASDSFDYGDGTNHVVNPAKRCFTLIPKTLTSISQMIGKRFDDPFVITSVSPVASGSNAVGWNLYVGAPGSVTTAVFSANKAASTSSYPKYTTFSTSTINDGQQLDIKTTSSSAAIQSLNVNICGRYTK